MFVYLRSLSLLSASLILILFTLIANLIAIVIVDKILDKKTLKDNITITNTVVSYIWRAFAVIVGFTIFIAMNWTNAATNATNSEANYLLALLRQSELFPPEKKEKVKQVIAKYVEYVIHDEWPLLRQEKKPGTQGEKYLQELQNVYTQSDLKTDESKILFSENLRDLNDFFNSRDARLLYNQTSLNPLLWVLIWFLGLLSISLLYLWHIDNFFYQVLIIITSAFTVNLMFFLVVSIDHPFSGVIRVEPIAFVQVLDYIKNS